MFWLKLAGGIVTGFVLIVAALYVIGSVLPREHMVTRRIVLKTASAETLWARVANPSATPSWRRSVTSVKRLDDRDGHAVWAEESGGNSTSYETLEAVPPRLLVRKVVDQTIYGGTWRIEIEPGPDGVSVTITENGWVDAPFFRALARFAFGYASTAESYLSDLSASIGEAVVVEKMEG
ncbi:MAG: hypothetical protein GC190_17745 [Alphaproteobacteria bacterium]|nr:hypothetical protein [Alphaproteobacteria bacterium]